VNGALPSLVTGLFEINIVIFLDKSGFLEDVHFFNSFTSHLNYIERMFQHMTLSQSNKVMFFE